MSGGVSSKYWIALGFLLTGTIACNMAITGGTMLLPMEVATLGLSHGIGELTISMPLIAAGATVVTVGRLGDRFGHRRLYLMGAFLMIMGSLLQAFAWSAVPLVLARIIQGVGFVALVTPIFAMARIWFVEPQVRGTAFGVIGAFVGISMLVAPLLIGWLEGSYGWRVCAAGPGAVAFLSALGVLIAAPKDGATSSVEFDPVAALALALGVGGLLFALQEGRSMGFWYSTLPAEEWSYAISPVAMVGGLGLLCSILFFRRQKQLVRQGKEGIIDMTLFLNRSFSRGTLLAVFFYIGCFALLVQLPAYFQLVRYEDVERVGHSMAFFGVGMTVIGFLVGPIGRKVSSRSCVVLGLAVLLTSLVVMAPSLTVDGPLYLVLGAITLFGAGFGLVYSKLMEIVLSNTPKEKGGLGSAVVLGARLVSGGVGAAIIGMVFEYTTDFEAVEYVQESNLTATDKEGLLMALNASALLTAPPAKYPAVMHKLSGEDSAELKKSIRYGHARATQFAVCFAIITVLLCFWAVLTIPRTSEESPA